MKVTLSPQKKQELEHMHDSTRDSRVCERIKAVLLASEGWSSAMISQDSDATHRARTLVVH